MRSARVAIISVALVLVLLPFALLLVAWLYEQTVVSTYRDDLERVATVAANVPRTEWPKLGREEGVWLRTLDSTIEGPSDTAIRNSAIGGTVERMLSLIGADTPLETTLPRETEPGVSERLRRTTDSLLQLVRLESALVTAERDTLPDYRAWLDALLDSYRSDPQHAGWTFELDATPCAAQVSAEAWASMLRNLVDNARVQPSASKRIRVRARVEDGALLTEVTDFGPGVSEGNREKIFQRFFTARPDGVERGTGLGLAIVKAVAEAHGGTVTLLPAKAQEGATFRVATPLPHGIPAQSPAAPQ